MAISNYLNALLSQKTALVNNLKAKGIDAQNTETFNTLVPKVLDISGGSVAGGINKKLYSFGVVSDIHLKDTTKGERDDTNSQTDYQRALTYFKNNDMDFVCIPGDIVANNRSANGSDPVADSEQEWINELTIFKNHNNAYFPGKEVHLCAGNHDATPLAYNNAPSGLGKLVTVYGDGSKTGEQVWKEITGKPVNYTFTKGNDVFIFHSMYFWNYVNYCRDQDITWLQNQLEANKNKRVFLFFHMPLWDTFDGPTSHYGLTASYNETTKKYVGRSGDFYYMAQKYPNVIWFNGHSHYRLSYESEYENPNVYQSGQSMKMIHCPSLAMPRKSNPDGTYSNMDAESEGYVVDVYDNHIVLNGIDFTKGTTISVANYTVS